MFKKLLILNNKKSVVKNNKDRSKFVYNFTSNKKFFYYDKAIKTLLDQTNYINNVEIKITNDEFDDLEFEFIFDSILFENYWDSDVMEEEALEYIDEVVILATRLSKIFNLYPFVDHLNPDDLLISNYGSKFYYSDTSITLTK